MFVPSFFRPTNPQHMVDLIRAYPLATLVTMSQGHLFATHLPIILAADANSDTGQADDVPTLVDAMILGHMNRRNPQYAALGSGIDGLLVFAGPNGYVSPAVYGTTPAAPTWNFTAVHLHGAITPLQAGDDTMNVVRSTSRIFEQRFGRGWDMTSSLNYFDKILPGVGAFRMRITTADGMFKLSQDQPDELRAKVATAFAANSPDELAQMMNRLAPS